MDSTFTTEPAGRCRISRAENGSAVRRLHSQESRLPLRILLPIKPFLLWIVSGVKY